MIKNKVAATSEKVLKDYNTKNELTTSMIFCAVSYEVLIMISSSTYIKEAWYRLNKIYLG